MPRYFKYKTPRALAAKASELNLDIRLSSDLEPLFQTAEVGGRRVGNRLVIQPMEGCDGNLDGSPGELTLRRYRRFGAGGAKLIWGEACAVVPEGRANPRQLVLSEPNAKSIEHMITACKDAHRNSMGSTEGLLIGLQLTHSGRYCCDRPILAQHDPLLDPRTVVDKRLRKAADSGYPLISDDALERLRDDYVHAARLAQRVGCDFVDIKQCHRYLLNELLAARDRPGRFGDSFENRTRFVRSLVERIRSECPGLIIATRLNVFDGLPFEKGADGRGIPVACPLPVDSCWGTCPDNPADPDLAEPIGLVGMLVELGVSLVNVTMGNPYTSPHILRPFDYPPPDGYEPPEHPMVGVARHFRLTEAVQRAFPGLAVVGSGYSWLQAYAFQAGAANVRIGRATFMGIGRAALAQPDFAARLMRNEPLDPKRTCRTFSYCTALMRSKHNSLGQFPTGCPPFDKEVYGPIWKQANGPASDAIDGHEDA